MNNSTDKHMYASFNFANANKSHSELPRLEIRNWNIDHSKDGSFWQTCAEFCSVVAWPDIKPACVYFPVP